jgi:DNA repair protein RecO (recombination protein O)
MLIEEDLGIVLRSVPFQERHRIVTGLTARFGKVSALARNSIQSRRFGGALEPFVASEWRFAARESSDLWRLDQATVRRAYEGLRADFTKLALASVFAEIILRVAPERSPAPELFKLLANSLALVEELPSEAVRGPGPPLNAFLTKILQWSGNQPRFAECAGCGKTLESLEPTAGLVGLVETASWMCHSCAGTEGEKSQESRPGLPLTAWALLDLYVFLVAPIRRAQEVARGSAEDHGALYRFLEALIRFHVPGLDREELRSLRFIDGRHGSE